MNRPPVPAAATLVAAAVVCHAAAAAGSTADPFADLVAGGIAFELHQPDPELAPAVGEPAGYSIACTRWQPDVPNGRTIVYLHGLQDHRGWFSPTALALAGAGYAVVACDRIGSGTSSDGLGSHLGRRFSARGHVRAWSLHLTTLDLVLDRVAADHPTHDVILWSTGYGAKLVTAYLIDRAAELERRRVSAAVFTNPQLFRNTGSMPRPFPKLAQLKGPPDRLLPVPMVERDEDNGAAWFVPPGEWFDRIRADRLSLRQVTRTFYQETDRLDQYWKYRRPNRRHQLPCFYQLVAGDAVADNARTERHIQTRAVNSVVKPYDSGPGHPHFLLLSAAGAEAVTDVRAFLEGRWDEIANATRVWVP
jgi:pimeloyl-ACP methyl ester carboxylesterase